MKIDIKKNGLSPIGIGGYAMSTINGMNTRKYHALLVAALGENFERYMVLSKINEEIEINKSVYSFSTNECPNYLEKGYKFEQSFVKEFLPEFYYNIHGVEVLKKIAMAHGENKVAITYIVKSNNNNVKLKLSPIVNFRNIHQVKSTFYLNQEKKDSIVKVGLNSKNNLFMKVSEGNYFEYYNTYYQNMFYREEKARGFECTESHFMPGYFEIEIEKNEEKVIEFVASVNDKLEFNMKSNALQIIKSEETRLEKWCKIYGAQSNLEKTLVTAADNFIIEKNYGKTIIAGYPWFSDWGRDTFIAFEGLLLKTNRFNDAKGILKSFSKHIKDGLVPNLIDENGGQSYNSVDASLWYIDAMYKYYQYTNDKDFIKELYPKMIEIIEAYKKGTKFGIKMDKDGLITAGDNTTQLTWMDAKIGSFIPTPRFGKAVEVNSLWYNALNIMRSFSTILNIDFDIVELEKVRESFKKFYAARGLYDTIEPESKKVRPNQVFAVSLSFPIVDNEKANELLELIEEKLLTNKGLKTLSADDDDYKSRYEGDSFSRDSSYHQGTVWPWLFMGYLEACYKIRRTPKLEPNIEEMLKEGCIGNICEIYDADEPRRPNGALAQAWSIAMAILYRGH
ncbi:MAG: glycogen debranching enzyme family protein [Clostridia bacterium]|nr:glycogen debranching enzyme family protein [Clostridia bacterium]